MGFSELHGRGLHVTIGDGYCTTGCCDLSIQSGLDAKKTSYEQLLAEFLADRAYDMHCHNRLGVWVIGEDNWLNNGFEDHVRRIPFLAGERSPDYRIVITHVEEPAWSAAGRDIWRPWLEEGGMTVSRPYADERQFANHANSLVERIFQAMCGVPLEAVRKECVSQKPSEVLQSAFGLPAAYCGRP